MKMFHTERLLLRQWRMEDLDDFHALMSNPSCPMGGWKPVTCKEEALSVLSAYTETDDVYAIVLKASGRAIGLIKMYADENRGSCDAKLISYLLHENVRNRGYMTEAVQCMVSHAFDGLNIDLLSAFVFPQNAPSRRVLEKSGFLREGVIPNGYLRYDGKRFDSVIYSLTKEQYRQSARK